VWAGTERVVAERRRLVMISPHRILTLHWDNQWKCEVAHTSPPISPSKIRVQRLDGQREATTEVIARNPIDPIGV
jgi:hypothetical protein